jgi:hypothetical protein
MAKPGAATEDYMTLMRERYSAAKTGWATIREDFRADLRYVSGDPGDQWDDKVKASRDDDGVPALTMDRLNPLVNQIINRARKDRPQPKVGAGDGGDPAVADAIEGKMRHCLYESHADIAFDTAEMYCASGGFGFYRITKEWTGKKGFTQEPRVKRIPDPLTVLFDPDVQEIDYSDARFCFVQKKYDRKDFKREFKKEPIPFPFDGDESSEWGDERKVVVAEYWWVEIVSRRLIQLADGRIGTDDELGEFEDDQIVNERQLSERIVHCDVVDGEKRLEESIWEGEFISIVPVIAQEIISEGKRRYKSAVRYSRDPQTFINASLSSTAQKLATINEAPFIGPKGAFKDKKWRDGKRHFYLEYETVTAGVGGAPLSPPQRNAFEPAIQGSTSATAQGVDALKGAIGYVDSVTRPSQADLAGIAVEKRDAQASLANMQYKDSLVQSMWHCGRIMVGLLLALTDTPREWQTRKEDGTSDRVPVTMDVPADTAPHAHGYEGQPHLKIDDGDYGVTINVGPSFNTKTEEGTDFLLALIKADPALIPIYAPAIFKRLGYEDLEEIANAAQPPQIRQALAQSSGKGPDPAMLAQQAQQLQAQNQHLQQILQQVSQVLKTKQIENEGRLAVQNAKTTGDLEAEKLKTIRALIEQSGQHAHEAAAQQFGAHIGAVKHMTDLLHSTELASNPPAPIQPTGAPNQ